MPSQSQHKRRAVQAPDKSIKRTRVSRACDQCRLAREKCDGTQPTCSTCSTSNRGCTYTANVKKRGIQPGYIRALELALAFLFQHNPENENLVNEQLAQGGLSSLLISRNSKESNKLHKKWRKARFYTEIDRLLSGGDAPRHDQSEPLSPDSDDDDSDGGDGTTTTLPADHSLKKTAESQLDSSAFSPSRILTPLVQANPGVPRRSMPLDSWKLFETYFDYTASWLPICEKHDVLKLSYSYPTEGLELSPFSPNSGSHAELWSVLALASLQGTSGENVASQSQEMYTTARSLVPGEQGLFDLGHVKALLNLAVFNITQSLHTSARVLVALACCIMDSFDENTLASRPRFKHVYHGCFILETILSMQLDRQVFSREASMDKVGPVDEDNLDEWQPWTRSNYHSSGQQSRIPLLALSSFNALSGIVEILADKTKSSQNGLKLLESWKSKLPAKLSYMRVEDSTGTLTPPSVLLQLVYNFTALTLSLSSGWVSRSLDLLERAQDQLKMVHMPPLVICLVELISRKAGSLGVDRLTEQRLNRLQATLYQTWPKKISIYQPPIKALPMPQVFEASDAHLSTPQSMANPVDRTALTNNTQASLSPFDPGLTHIYPMATPSQYSSSVRETPVPAQLDHRFPEISTDLESFFDDLATLDSSTNMDNQPQFMQNLGFAPDANMADLFSECELVTIRV